MEIIAEILVLANAILWSRNAKRMAIPKAISLCNLEKKAESETKLVHSRVVSMIALYFWLIGVQDTALIVSGFHNTVFAVFFTSIVVYEFAMINIAASEFIPPRSAPTLLVILMSELLIITMIATLKAGSFELLNIVDFCALVVKIGISAFLLGKIVLQNKLKEYFELFLIMSAFAVFFLTQMAVSFFLAKSFQNNYEFNVIGLLFGYSLWLGVSLILWKLLLKSYLLSQQ